jgi:hypothetical protein
MNHEKLNKKRSIRTEMWYEKKTTKVFKKHKRNKAVKLKPKKSTFDVIKNQNWITGGDN